MKKRIRIYIYFMELSTTAFIAVLKCCLKLKVNKLTMPFLCNKYFYYVLSTCTLSSQLVREISGPDSPITVVGSISSASNAIVVILSAPHVPDAWQRTSHFL